MNKHMPGLDGLRALAVMAVLLFHAFPHALPGGFIGVDIFFVISGYIITKTYFNSLRSGQVSLRQFYVKRFRRLAPAYILVLILTTVTAYLLINPLYLKNYGESLIAQPFYLQNIVFWRQGDYFEAPLTKPLLHTWSLAVEEQFYLLYGLFILFARKRPTVSITWLLAALAVLALGSFGASYIIGQISPKTSFFLLPTRLWELAIGVGLGLVTVILPAGLAQSMKWGGLAAMVAAVALFGETAATQSIQALLVCAGTGAAILGVAGLRARDRLLDLPAVAYVGKISYSLYLWHWPIISIATIYLGHELSTTQALGALALTAACSALSYRYVELPFRTGALLKSNGALLGSMAGTTAIVAGTAFILMATDGAVYRYPHQLAVLYSAEQQRSPYRCPIVYRIAHPTSEMCQRNEVRSDNNVLIIGDSHADQLDELVAALGERKQVGVFLATRNCNLHDFGADSYCSNAVLKKLLDESSKRGIRNVIAISFFKGNFASEKQLREVLSKAVLAGNAIDNIFIMQVVPNGRYFNPHEWIEVIEKKTQGPKVYTMRDYQADNKKLISALDNIKEVDGRIKILDPSPFICTSDTCRFASNGVPNYFDSHHLSPTGVRLLLPIFQEAIDAVTEGSKRVQADSGPPKIPDSQGGLHGKILH
jgi:peptidoglycan/LPS O-acetylase OafA/YrhL